MHQRELLQGLAAAQQQLITEALDLAELQRYWPQLGLPPKIRQLVITTHSYPDFLCRHTCTQIRAHTNQCYLRDLCLNSALGQRQQWPHAEIGAAIELTNQLRRQAISMPHTHARTHTHTHTSAVQLIPSGWLQLALRLIAASSNCWSHQ